ncbi:MAG: hypothetical protein Q8Q42_01075 [Nanoarchaeota archaeon]|nr:hypothetical protein [Nanoarchaeota archaeon]
MNIKKIYEAGKKGLAGIVLAGTLALNGCVDHQEHTTQELPYFAVKNIETVLAMDHGERPRHVENGVVYTPMVRFDTQFPQLEGVKAQQGDKTYIFRSSMYDGRLTEISNTEGEAYLRVGMLPEEFNSFNDGVGKGADTSYAKFIEEFNK